MKMKSATTEFLSGPRNILPSDDDFLRIIVPATSDEEQERNTETIDENDEDLEMDDDLDEDTDEDFDDDSSDDDDDEDE
jgi:hypothetical protein